MAQRVALIGAGAMGFAIGSRLLETGHALSVHDRNPPKVAALAEKGARGAGSAAEAAEGAGVVLTSLNSAASVEAAILGESGAAERAEAGALVVDMSSIDPAATRRLAAQAAARGLRWVDSPLSGGAPKALTGELTLMCGGEAEDVAAARAVLDDLSARCAHMGPVGAGQATKLVNQLLCGVGFLAVAEATALAEAAGVDVSRIPDALSGGRADSAILREYMPRFGARDYRRTGRIDNMVKDLDGALDLARAGGAPLPLAALAAELHRALARAGLGGEDQAALMELFDGLDRSRFE